MNLGDRMEEYWIERASEMLGSMGIDRLKEGVLQSFGDTGAQFAAGGNQA